MTYLARFLEYGLYILLALSAMTVFAFIVFLVRRARKDPQATKPKAVTAYIGAATSIGTLVIAIINLVHPIGLVEQDPGRVAIEQYFQAVSRKDFESVLKLLHPDRISEIQGTTPNFGRETLRALYEPLVGYNNLRIKEGVEQGVRARIYSVAVDTEEMWPRSSFYAKQSQRLDESIKEGLLGEKRIVEVILEDLRSYYDVPDNLVPRIREVMLTKKWESIFSPAFTYELRRDLKDDNRIDLVPKAHAATRVPIRRHFVFNLRVADDGGVWKIRSGLSDPPLVASYREKGPWSK